MDRWVIGYIWFLSLMGALFYGHEIGVMKGEHFTKLELNAKLQQCHEIIVSK